VAETQSPPGEPTEAEIAAGIALILSGQAPEQVAAAGGVGAAVALALLAFVPASLPWPERASVSAEAAELVLRDRPDHPSGSGAILAARRGNLVYRALYGINATRRIVSKVAGGEGSLGERLKGAVKAEAPYFAAHKDANERRLRGAELVDAASNAFGPILGWNHGPNGPGDRPHHVKAHGLNFDVRNPPRETEGLPGTLLHCGCFPGPPKQGARVMR
jgi:hypothetical protein